MEILRIAKQFKATQYRICTICMDYVDFPRSSGEDVKKADCWHHRVWFF